MTADVPRTLLGLTAEQFWVGAAAVVVLSICCDSIGLALARRSAARILASLDRPSALPAYRREAISARRGKW